MQRRRSPDPRRGGRAAGVSPATLKRWAASGVIPELTDSGRSGPPRPSPTPASWPACARAGTASSRSARPPRGQARLRLHRGRCSPTPQKRHVAQATRPRQTGLEPALIERFWTSIGLPRAALERAHATRTSQALHYVGVGARRGLPAGRVPPALPRVRAGAVADRRRRGAPVPPLRARAADARGRARARDGRGDGGARARPAAALLADDGLRPPAASSSTSSSRTWSATWRWSSRTRTRTSAACAWRSPSPTSPATRASPRRRARRRRCRRSSASSRGSRTRCRTTRAW